MSDSSGIGGGATNAASEMIGNVTSTIGSELKNIAGAAVSQTTGMQLPQNNAPTQQQISQMAAQDKAMTEPLLQKDREELKALSSKDTKKDTNEPFSTSFIPSILRTKKPSSPQTPEQIQIKKSMETQHHEEAQQLGQKTPEQLALEQQEEQEKQMEEEQKRQEEEAKKMSEAPVMAGSKGKGEGGKQKTPLVIQNAVDKDKGRQRQG